MMEREVGRIGAHNMFYTSRNFLIKRYFLELEKFADFKNSQRISHFSRHQLEVKKGRSTGNWLIMDDGPGWMTEECAGGRVGETGGCVRRVEGGLGHGRASG